MGIAMGCRAGTHEVQRWSEKDEIQYVDLSPLIHIDFMIAIKAGVGTQIPYAKVRSFIRYLRAVGFPITLSADTYQSVDTLQILEREGVDCKHISVDRDDVAYRMLRGATMEDRIDYYEYPIYIKEVSKLIHYNGKVDHPLQGSKDVSDAVAGVVFRIQTETTEMDDKLARSLPVDFMIKSMQPPKSKDALDRNWISSDYDAD